MDIMAMYMCFMQVRATDMDLGDFGQVRYRIITGDFGRFNITEYGEVNTATVLDYENTAEYVISIEAYDLAGAVSRR